LALKRVRSSAGIAAQAIPPSAPATIIAGSSSGEVDSWNSSARPPPQIAPIVSCPSAPMFQTLAR
jgi:hypothetical protein